MGPDMALYYNYTTRPVLDVVAVLAADYGLGFIHETAHGLTCKHYGGQVHSMGLMFLYLMPAFYVDMTEVWVYSTKMQRLAAIIAGIWIEMVICGLAMIVWLNTQPGKWLHDFAYPDHSIPESSSCSSISIRSSSWTAITSSLNRWAFPS